MKHFEFRKDLNAQRTKHFAQAFRKDLNAQRAPSFCYPTLHILTINEKLFESPSQLDVTASKTVVNVSPVHYSFNSIGDKTSMHIQHLIELFSALAFCHDSGWNVVLKNQFAEVKPLNLKKGCFL